MLGFWWFPRQATNVTFDRSPGEQVLPEQLRRVPSDPAEAIKGTGAGCLVEARLLWQSPSFQDAATEALADVLGLDGDALASSFPQVHIKVIYANKSAETPHPNVKAKGDRLRRELAKITSGTRADLEYLNATDLRERTARGAKAVAQLVFTETPMSTSLAEGYVRLARLDEYYRFITSDNEALRLELFESNVGDYAGSTAVNNAIGETLRSGTGEDFWLFNNGVVTATR
ncbi:AIPR family protein [Streptomyces sp. NPDC001340]